MSRSSAAQRLRVRTLCRIAPRSTSAQVRLGTLGMTRPVKCLSETGSYDVQGEDVHAGYHPDEPPSLDDRQYLLTPFGHGRRGLGESRFGSYGHGIVRHHLAHGDTRALERLPAILIRIPARPDPTRQRARPR